MVTHTDLKSDHPETSRESERLISWLCNLLTPNAPQCSEAQETPADKTKPAELEVMAHDFRTLAPEQLAHFTANPNNFLTKTLFAIRELNLLPYDVLDTTEERENAAIAHVHRGELQQARKAMKEMAQVLSVYTPKTEEPTKTKLRVLVGNIDVIADTLAPDHAEKVTVRDVAPTATRHTEFATKA